MTTAQNLIADAAEANGWVTQAAAPRQAQFITWSKPTPSGTPSRTLYVRVQFSVVGTVITASTARHAIASHQPRKAERVLAYLMHESATL